MTHVALAVLAISALQIPTAAAVRPENTPATTTPPPENTWTISSSPWREGLLFNARLGFRVAIEEGTVVMSQWGRDDGRGAVIVSNLTTERSYDLFVADADAVFGQAVAIDGGSIVVGGTSNYYFGVVGGRVELTMPSDAAGSHISTSFGNYYVYSSVAIDGDVVVVGCRGEAFMCSTKVGLCAKLQPEGSTDMSSFGESVAMDDGVVVIGSPTEGAVYTFDKSGRQQQQPGKIVPDPDEDDSFKESQFGCAVAIDEGFIAIGAKNADVVYLYSTSTGKQLLRKFGNGDEGSGFGKALAMEGSQIVVGAPWARDWVGSAYVYDLLGNQQKKLVPRDAAEPGHYFLFGHSVAISQGKVVVGAPFANSVGSVYVFDA